MITLQEMAVLMVYMVHKWLSCFKKSVIANYLFVIFFFRCIILILIYSRLSRSFTARGFSCRDPTRLNNGTLYPFTLPPTQHPPPIAHSRYTATSDQPYAPKSHHARPSQPVIISPPSHSAKPKQSSRILTLSVEIISVCFHCI